MVIPLVTYTTWPCKARAVYPVKLDDYPGEGSWRSYGRAGFDPSSKGLDVLIIDELPGER